MDSRRRARPRPTRRRRWPTPHAHRAVGARRRRGIRSTSSDPTRPADRAVTILLLVIGVLGAWLVGRRAAGAAAVDPAAAHAGGHRPLHARTRDPGAHPHRLDRAGRHLGGRGGRARSRSCARVAPRSGSRSRPACSRRSPCSCAPRSPSAATRRSSSSSRRPPADGASAPPPGAPHRPAADCGRASVAARRQSSGVNVLEIDRLGGRVTEHVAVRHGLAEVEAEPDPGVHRLGVEGVARREVPVRSALHGRGHVDVDRVGAEQVTEDPEAEPLTQAWPLV